MTSPICLYKVGAGSYSATTNGPSVAASSVITITLNDLSGCDIWSLTCVGCDENQVAATITAGISINQALKTATFTMPSSPTCLVFQSIINNAVDINGRIRTDWISTFELNVKTVMNAKLLAVGEQLENDSTFGWIPKINSITSGGTTLPAGAANTILWSNGTANSFTLAPQIGAAGTGTVGIGAAPTGNKLYLNSGASPTVAQLLLQASNAGALGAYVVSPDNEGIFFDGEYIAGGFTARATSAGLINKQSGKISIFGNTGLTAGNTYSPTVRLNIDLSNGFLRLGDGTVGAQQLDMTGSALVRTKLSVGVGTLPPNGQAMINGELFVDWSGTTNGGAFRMASNSNQAFIASNQYYNSGIKYARTGGASVISFDTTATGTAGSITFQTAPSGTADAAATFTTRLTLSQAGALQLNAYTAGVLQTDGSGNVTAGSVGPSSITAGGTNTVLWSNGSVNSFTGAPILATSLQIGTIGSAGNIGIGGAPTTNKVYLNSAVTPTYSQVLVQANGFGALSLLNYAANNIYVGFDMTREGGSFIARNGTMAAIGKVVDQFNIYGSAGNTIGSAGAMTVLANWDLSSGFLRIGDSALASQPLDVVGNAKVSGRIGIGAGPTSNQLYVNSAASPTVGQMLIQANAAGGIGMYNLGADNLGSTWDAEYISGGFIAKHADVAIFTKNNGFINWYASTGNTIGSGPTITKRWALQISSGHVSQYGRLRLGDTTLTVPTDQLELVGANISWDNITVGPALYQKTNTTASATGQILTVQAQNCSGATSVGGKINIKSGSGTSSQGTIDFYHGSTLTASWTNSAGDTRLSLGSTNAGMRFLADTGTSQYIVLGVAGTTPLGVYFDADTINFRSGAGGFKGIWGNSGLRLGDATAATDKLELNTGNISWDIASSAPKIYQKDRTATASGQVFTIQAQSGFNTGNGGDIALIAGAKGLSGTTDGSIIFRGQKLRLQTQGSNDCAYFDFTTGGAGKFRLGDGTPPTATLEVVGTSTYQSSMSFTSTCSSSSINQVSSNAASTTGSLMSILAQSMTGTTSTGAGLTLSSGSGTSANGDLLLQVAGTTKIRITGAGLIGLYGVTPVAQAADMLALTTSVGTFSTTVPDVGSSFNQTTLNNIVKTLVDQINKLRTADRNIGIMA